MESKLGSPVDPSALSKASENLHKSSKGVSTADALDYDRSVAAQYAELYEKHDGNIREIFEELNESPRKALKHPPANATDFGIKYAQGFYTLAEEK